MLEILDPFEITCADPSRIRKYVRNQRHISLEKNLISLRCSRTIGAFGHELRVDLGRVLFCDNVFKEHVSKRSNIAKALNCTRRLLEVHLEVPSRFFDIDGHTSAGGRISSKRSSDYQRFAGDDSEGIVSFVLAVLIHEPCHSLRVCVNVRCGNVSEGTNYLADQRKERSRQSL